MNAKFRFPGYTMALTVALLAGCATKPPAPANAIKPYKIILIGDSTVAVQGGWGSSFCSEHVTSFVACLNLARGGRSSGSYISEGSWAVAVNEAAVKSFVTTWVLIQFGHNDQPGKPGRSTDLATEYPANLARYVRETRAVGAVPVLVTPLTRRIFKDGQLQNDLPPWGDAMKRVAAELEVPLIDLNALSSAAVQTMGSTRANVFALSAPSEAVAAASATGTTIAATTGVTETNDPPSTAVPGMAQPKRPFDYTHLGREGSDYFAAMMTMELARQLPDLRPLLIP